MAPQTSIAPEQIASMTPGANQRIEFQKILDWVRNLQWSSAGKQIAWPNQKVELQKISNQVQNSPWTDLIDAGKGNDPVVMAEVNSTKTSAKSLSNSKDSPAAKEVTNKIGDALASLILPRDWRKDSSQA